MSPPPRSSLTTTALRTCKKAPGEYEAKCPGAKKQRKANSEKAKVTKLTIKVANENEMKKRKRRKICAVQVGAVKFHPALPPSLPSTEKIDEEGREREGGKGKVREGVGVSG